jgi:protein tyrosine phosphatase (PTP) superfamily phosphohydrolase (DUF442 family)
MADGINSKHLIWRHAAISVAVVAVVGVALFFVFRNIVFNAYFHPVVEGQVYRAPQPSADQLRGWIDQYGFRTVVNLRGHHGEIDTERAVAKEAGVRLGTFELAAGLLPTRAQLLRLIHVLESADRPMLIHCRNGVDRTGLASAMVELMEGRGMAQARGQLPMFKTNDEPDHVCDVIKLYDEYCTMEGLAADEWSTFKQWAEGVYMGGATSRPGIAAPE